MKMIFVSLFTIVVLTGFSFSTSFAEMYVSGSLGTVNLNDSDFSDSGVTGKFSFDSGLGVTAALGSSIGSSGRAEIEFAYRSNDMDSLTVDGIGTASINGEVTSLSLMGNAYYDIKNDSRFTTFVGAGLGFANIEAEIDTLNIGSEDDTVFAYQAMLGVGYAATEKVNIDLQYRYFATTDPDFAGLDAEYSSHNILLGLRYAF